MPLRSTACLALLIVSLWGCEDPASQVCAPNITQACLCPGAPDGVQTCLGNGSGFSVCQCAGTDVISDMGTDTTSADTSPSDTTQTDTTQPDTAQPDANNCTQTLCGTACVDTNTAVAHCGSCDNACGSGPNGTATCTSGACGLDCAAGFYNCDTDASTGCETSFSCDAIVASGAGNGAATSVWLSGDGRYVVFTSEASDLVADDTNGVADIFLLDRLDGSTERINLSGTGGEADDASFEPVISEDGRFIAYTSDATNIVAFDLNVKRDLFLYDVQAATTTRLSMGSDGSEADDNTSGRPSISASGRFTAFASVATNIIADDTNGVSDAFVHDKEAGRTERVSIATPSGEGGILPSMQPAISGDGRFVVFTSGAANFLYDDILKVSEDTNRTRDIYLHDRQTQSTDRVSADPGRAQVVGSSHSPAISADGRFIAFMSNAAFGSGPAPTADEVFLVDVQTGAVERISTGANNTAANGTSSSVSLSRDGRFVTFASAATNLTPFDTNASTDIFLFDRQGGMTRVNVNASGDESDADSRVPFISADARFIAFVSSATNLVASDSNNGIDDVFVLATGVEATPIGPVGVCQAGESWCVGMGCVASGGAPFCGGCGVTCTDSSTYTSICDSSPSCTLDCISGLEDCNGLIFDGCEFSTTAGPSGCPALFVDRVSISSDGTQGNDHSNYGPSVSGDGRFVAFDSAATNLVPNDTNGVDDIFVHDRQTRTTELISVSSDGTQANDRVFGQPSISEDGRVVAFGSYATNLVAGDTNDVRDIFVHDRLTGTTERVSVASDGTQTIKPLNSQLVNASPSISGDGRFVAFASNAKNLVAGDDNAALDIFVHDRQTGMTERVSVASDGSQATGNFPSISEDGQFVAFYSASTNLVAGDTNGVSDIFVHDRQTKTTERVSLASDGTQANDHSSQGPPPISGDGRFVAFGSSATNLVAGDTNGVDDVFVHDRQTGTTERVSVAPDGSQASDGTSGSTSISGDGRFATFWSNASNLVVGDTNNATDVFVHDRQTGTVERVSIASDGSQANNVSYLLSISTDGRVVAFRSYANNLVVGDTNDKSDIFVHYTNSP